jgi:hypothetical protein
MNILPSSSVSKSKPSDQKAKERTSSNRLILHAFLEVEYGGSTFLQNVGKLIQDYTALTSQKNVFFNPQVIKNPLLEKLSDL